VTTTTGVVLPLDVLDSCYLAAERLGDIATVTGFYVLAWLYASNHHTDGHVPAAFVFEDAKGFVEKPSRFASAMVKAKLWEETPDGWRIKAYTLCNPTVTEQGAIDALRERKRLNKQQERARRQGDIFSSSTKYIDPVQDPGTTTSPAKLSPCRLTPVEAFRIYKRCRGGLPDFTSITKDRKRNAATLCRELNAYATEMGVDPCTLFADVVAAIAKNPWMAGKNDSGWKADVDFVFKPGTWARAVEGKYVPRQDRPKTAEETRQAIRNANVRHVTDGAIHIVD
jgi:hypothetical protein